MITVKIIYTNGTFDIKDCLDISDICLDGVALIRILRDERKIA